MQNQQSNNYIESRFFEKLAKYFLLMTFSLFLFIAFLGIIHIIKEQNEVPIDIKISTIKNQSQQIDLALSFYEDTNDEEISHLYTLVEQDILLSIPVFENETWKINNSETSLFIKDNTFCEQINKRLHDPVDKWDAHLRCDRINNDLSKIVILRK